jgi:hypothetical protein
VVLLTVVPVIAGLVGAELLALDAGLLRLAGVAPLLVMQLGVGAFGVVAYARAAADPVTR